MLIQNLLKYHKVRIVIRLGDTVNLIEYLLVKLQDLIA